MMRQNSTRRTALLIAVSSVLHAPVAASVITWDGTCGSNDNWRAICLVSPPTRYHNNWDTGFSMSPSGPPFPGPADQVMVNSSTVRLNTTETVDQFSTFGLFQMESGGRLNALNPFQGADYFGEVRAFGLSAFGTGIHVLHGPSFLSGTGIDNGQVINNGVCRATQQLVIQGNSAAFVNNSGAQLRLDTVTQIDGSGLPPGQLINYGEIYGPLFSGSEVDVAVPFQNDLGVFFGGNRSVRFSAGGRNIEGRMLSVHGIRFTTSANFTIITSSSNPPALAGPFWIDGGNVTLSSDAFLTTWTLTAHPSQTSTLYLAGQSFISHLNWHGGLINGSGSLWMNGISILGDAEKRLENGAILQSSATTWNGSGPLLIGASCRFLSRGGFSIFNDVALGTRDVGSFENRGAFVKEAATDAGITDVNVPFLNIEGGTVECLRGTLRFAQFMQVGATLIANQTGQLSFPPSTSDPDSGLALPSGFLRGSGTILGNVSNSSGTVDPGAADGSTSFGVITVDGNYQQGGMLRIQIGGRTPGVEYDRLQATGSVSFSEPPSTPQVSVEFVNGFVPDHCDTFDVLTCHHLVELRDAGLINLIAPPGWQLVAVDRTADTPAKLRLMKRATVTPPFSRYAQGGAAWASKCVLPVSCPPSEPCNCPSPGCLSTVHTMRAIGCTITSFTNGILALIHENNLPFDPLPRPDDVLRFLRETRQLTRCGDIHVKTVWYFKRTTEGVPAFFWAVRERLDFDQVIASVLPGEAYAPVIMAVPRNSTANDNTLENLQMGKCHYIVAYGYDESVDSMHSSPSGLQVVDTTNWQPRAYPNSAYTQAGQSGFVPSLLYDGTTWTGPTWTGPTQSLADFFEALSRADHERIVGDLVLDYAGRWGDFSCRDSQRIREWFGDGNNPNGNLYQSNMTSQLSSCDTCIPAKRTATVHYGLELPAGRLAASVVHSPVQVAFVDRMTGLRYVSDASLANPGDTILSHGPIDIATTVEDSHDPEPPESTPPYALELPPELYGRSLDVEIHGIGNGPYSISYLHPGPDYAPPAPLTGVTTPGQIDTGTLDLLYTCPPVITVPPTGVTARIGDEVMLNVGGLGQYPLEYQWRKDGMDLMDDGIIFGAQSPTLYIYALAASHGGSYDVTISSMCGATTSMAVQVSPCTQLPNADSNGDLLIDGDDIAIWVQAWSMPAPPSDACAFDLDGDGAVTPLDVRRLVELMLQ